MFKGILSIGIDPSLTGTGVAVVKEGELLEVVGWTEVKALQKEFPTFLNWYKPKNSNDSNRIHRISIVATWVYSLIDHYVSLGYGVFVAIEGYAVSQFSNRASDLHELGGIIKQDLWASEIPYRIYVPQDIKQAFVGSGNADKTQMVMACLKIFDKDFSPMRAAGENLVDAIFLAHLLDRELRLKSNSQVNIEPNVKKVLTKTTKKNPVPLLKQEFILKSKSVLNKPIFGGLNK